MKGAIVTNKNIINITMFAMGAAVGSAVTWIFIKKKYEKITQEKVESVKEIYAKHNKSEPETESVSVADETPVFDNETYEEYTSMTSTYGGDLVPNVGSDKPAVISPYEFGELEDYDQVSLTYYADGVLTDENDCLIEDVESIVGFESLSHFGEYEDDSVFVRNDRLETDYEILRDQRNYTDVLNKKPYLKEDE